MAVAASSLRAISEAAVGKVVCEDVREAAVADIIEKAIVCSLLSVSL